MVLFQSDMAEFLFLILTPLFRALGASGAPRDQGETPFTQGDLAIKNEIYGNVKITFPMSISSFQSF